MNPLSGRGAIPASFKMGRTSAVKAYVKAGDKYYVASRDVKVTIGEDTVLAGQVGIADHVTIESGVNSVTPFTVKSTPAWG